MKYEGQFISCSNDLRKYLDMPFEDNIEFNAISTDTRSIEKGSLFIAIDGPNFDGNKFVDEAFDKGATAVLCSDKKYKDHPDKACIYVPSVRNALIQIATNICDEFNGKKILITGSNGKTTCTFLLSNSLPNCSSTIGNFNNEIGLPLSVMQADRDSEYLVLEAGAGKPGDIAILSEVVKPHLGLITSIAESHTEFLGDIEGVFKEKTSMLKDIEKDGTFIIGYEFEDEDEYENVNLFSDLFEMPLCKDISIKKINLDIVNLNLAIFRSNEERLKYFKNSTEFMYSEKPLCIVKFADDMSSMSFDYHFDHWDEGFSERGFSSHLIGLQNIKNIILIARCLDELQKENTSDNFIENLKKTLLSAEVQSFSRLKHSSWHRGAHLIDDSYNANPASVKAAIEMLSFASSDKFERRILILGDMLELKDPIKSHVEIGNFIYDKGIDVLITFGDLAEKVVHTVEEKAKERRIVTPFKCLSYKNEDEDKLKGFLEDFIKKDDIVIIKGSRGMRMERFI